MSGVYVIDEDQDDVIEITELPVEKWTRDYKTMLEKMASDKPASEGATEDPSQTRIIDDLREYHTQNRVHFWIQTVEGKLA